MEKKRLFSAISGGNVSLPLHRWKRCKRLVLTKNASAEEEEIIEFEVEEREESDSEDSKIIYDLLVKGERWVVSKEVKDALLEKEEEEMSPSECVSSVNNDFDSKLCEDLVRGFVSSMSENEEEETIEFEVEEREESDNEESNTYDVLVEGGLLVVSKEVRDALLKKEEDEMSPSECVSFVNNDFDLNLCEDLVRGFVTSMSKNGVNAEMSATPFSAKKMKIKPLLKWIIGPAVARNRARMLPPLH